MAYDFEKETGADIDAMIAGYVTYMRHQADRLEVVASNRTDPGDIKYFQQQAVRRRADAERVLTAEGREYFRRTGLWPEEGFGA
ncbi:hypothetical protein [Streptomyces sp. WZ-12]|uniref:hypothetical protein n=1 Tax=Streptomyces sp. WZ-12 TaxID=3030210 RepID=UPI002380C7FA|nr:hypothetical protein [Streptomyces sp. WZ-12]